MCYVFVLINDKWSNIIFYAVSLYHNCHFPKIKAGTKYEYMIFYILLEHSYVLLASNLYKLCH